MPGTRSTETYSRDVLTPAVRALAQVLHDIRDGRFVPDAPRSAMFPEVRAPPPADASSHPEEEAALHELDASSASSGNEEADLPFDDAVQRSAPKAVLGPLMSPRGPCLSVTSSQVSYTWPCLQMRLSSCVDALSLLSIQ